jgi:hypothetical protein
LNPWSHPRGMVVVDTLRHFVEGCSTSKSDRRLSRTREELSRKFRRWRGASVDICTIRI